MRAEVPRITIHAQNSRNLNTFKHSLKTFPGPGRSSKAGEDLVRMTRPIASLFVVSIALGQDSSRIITDRPSTTNTPETVPKGMVQVENGVRVTADQGQQTVTFSETLVRIGVLSSTELRLTAPSYS